MLLHLKMNSVFVSLSIICISEILFFVAFLSIIISSSLYSSVTNISPICTFVVLSSIAETIFSFILTSSFSFALISPIVPTNVTNIYLFYIGVYDVISVITIKCFLYTLLMRTSINKIGRLYLYGNYHFSINK